MFRRSLIVLTLTLSWLPSSSANPAIAGTARTAIQFTAAAVVTSGAYYINNSLKELKKQTQELEDQHTQTTKELKILKRQNALILGKVYDLETVVERVNKRFDNNQSASDEALESENPAFLNDEGEVDEHLLTRSGNNESDKDVLTRRGIIVMETEDSE